MLVACRYKVLLDVSTARDLTPCHNCFPSGLSSNTARVSSLLAMSKGSSPCRSSSNRFRQTRRRRKVGCQTGPPLSVGHYPAQEAIAPPPGVGWEGWKSLHCSRWVNAFPEQLSGARDAPENTLDEVLCDHHFLAGADIIHQPISQIGRPCELGLLPIGAWQDWTSQEQLPRPL